jgi:hypothetical protein
MDSGQAEPDGMRDLLKLYVLKVSSLAKLILICG